MGSALPVESGGAPGPRDPLGSLLEGVAGGEPGALEDLYARTSRRLYGLALRIVRDPGLAEDVALEVYAALWRGAAARYDGGRGDALAWLLLLTRSRAIDALRRRGREQKDGEPLEAAHGVPDGGPGPEVLALGADTSDRVRRALSRLRPEQRQAVEAAFFGGLSHSEVATSLGVPLGTIKTRIRSGLALLKRELSAAEGRE